MLCGGHQDDPMSKTEGRARLGWGLAGMAATRPWVLTRVEAGGQGGQRRGSRNIVESESPRNWTRRSLAYLDALAKATSSEQSGMGMVASGVTPV